MDLLASTFYRKNSASQAATQTRLAQAEANKAADALQRLIDQPPPPERAAPVIDQTINRLTVLHRRIDQHSALLADVLEAEEKLKEQRGLQQARVDELAALLADALAAAAALETKRLSISEELVLVKSQLSKEREELEEHSAIKQEDHSISGEHVRISKFCSNEWDGSIDDEEVKENA